MQADTLLVGGAALIAAGMAIAFVGVLSPTVFPAGTWVILLGLLACAGAGVLGLMRAGAAERDGRSA